MARVRDWCADMAVLSSASCASRKEKAGDGNSKSLLCEDPRLALTSNHTYIHVLSRTKYGMGPLAHDPLSYHATLCADMYLLQGHLPLKWLLFMLCTIYSTVIIFCEFANMNYAQTMIICIHSEKEKEEASDLQTWCKFKRWGNQGLRDRNEDLSFWWAWPEFLGCTWKLIEWLFSFGLIDVSQNSLEKRIETVVLPAWDLGVDTGTRMNSWIFSIWEGDV